MAESVLTDAERQFLEELRRRGVTFLVVGLTAATLQGANTTTVDIDLWFESITDPRIGEAARAAGGIWVSGTFGMQPPTLGGALGDRFDVVLHLSGLDTFAKEYSRARTISVEGIELHVLPLDRILVSKRAAGRPKDLAVIPALEEALAAVADADGSDV